jgi:AraC-like DNA-binding protein
MNLTSDIYLRIVNAKRYIDENYHEPIDLEVVSKKAFISKFHFHRLFRKVYRQTPHQYITRKRIDKAKDLLAENKPVNEVCNEVGFESIGSFSILFKKEIGFCPHLLPQYGVAEKTRSETTAKEIHPALFY